MYGENSIFNGVDVKQCWRVIPAKHIEIGFDNHKEYVNYMYRLRFKSEPLFLDIKLITQYSEDNDAMD